MKTACSGSLRRLSEVSPVDHSSGTIPAPFAGRVTSTQAKLCFMAFCDPSVWSLIPTPHSTCSWWSQDTECSKKVFLLMLHLCGAHAFSISSGKGKGGFPGSQDAAAPQHQVHFCRDATCSHFAGSMHLPPG